MAGLLCSEGFKKFLCIADDESESGEEMLRFISEDIPQAAEECSIGRLGIRIKLDPTPVSDPVNSNRDIYVSPKGYGSSSVTFEYKTFENGTVTIVCSPVKDHDFTDEEKEAARALSRLCFLLCSRTRAVEIMKLSEKKDTLTGAFNIKGLSEYVSRLIAEKKFSDYAGVFINIRHFKYINTRIGSRQGDKLLLNYCKLIMKKLGRDGAVARIGGDNYVVVVNRNKLEEFVSGMSAVDMEFGPLTVHVEAKIGIYEIKPHDGFSTMMNNVTIAMEHPTKDGSNVVRLTDEVICSMLKSKEISTSFSDALENGEFVVYYQPKVDTNTNTLCGCEALTRWIRDGRVVPPMDFIPILEQDGAVCRLDFYVLEAVCKDLRRWIDSGLDPVCVSVNFSKVHFHDEKLAVKIADVLKKYNIDGKYIEAELTEMSGFDDVEAMKRFIAQMHKNGIKTSIDDFGTGYSSLNLLKSLDVDIIKLDKSFINSIENHLKNDEVVIKNIVNMVNELYMEIIAEGVETGEQADFLKRINCSTVQGFLFDKPMPEKEFVKRLGNRVYDPVPRTAPETK